MKKKAAYAEIFTERQVIHPDMPIDVLPFPEFDEALADTPNTYHAIFPLSGGLSACARRWAQFWVGLAAWGVEAGKKSLAIKKFTPAVITAKF